MRASFKYAFLMAVQLSLFETPRRSYKDLEDIPLIGVYWPRLS